MAYSSSPMQDAYGAHSDPADHLSATDYQDHLTTYRGFVRVSLLSAAHILALLLLLYFFFVR